jgi:hypothetical protein
LVVSLLRRLAKHSLFLRWTAALVLFAALLVWVHYAFGWRALLTPWTTMATQELAAAVAMLTFSYFMRACRIFDYFGRSLCKTFQPCLRVVLLHNLLNNILPFRTGEIAFPALMKQYFAIPPSRTLPALLWLRSLDLHFLVLAGVTIFLAGRFSLAAGLGFSVVFLGLSFILYGLCRRLETRYGASRSLAGRLSGLIGGSVPAGKAAMIRSYGWTAANWSAKLLLFAWIVTRFAPIPRPTAILGGIAGELSGVLPVHGLAGAGTYEAGVLAALIPSGIPLDKAMTAAVNLHLLILGTAVIGALAAIALARPTPVGSAVINGETPHIDSKQSEEHRYGSAPRNRGAGRR